MNYSNELYFLQNTLNKCHIQTIIIDPNTEISKIDSKDYRSLLIGTQNNETFKDFFPNIENNTIYSMTDPFNCIYVFMVLPDCQKVLIVGPYLSEDITHQQILERCEAVGLSPEMSKRLEILYATVPVIKDDIFIKSLVNSFGEFVWDGSANFKTATVDYLNAANLMNQGIGLNNSSNQDEFSISAMEQRYDFENSLIDAVAVGNLNAAQLMMSNFSSLAFENRVTDRIRNLKNYSIIMNTLFRKAAEKGGVHPIYIDKVSSDFAKKIENVLTVNEIKNIMPEILQTYCKLVKNNSTKGFSPPVKKVIIKIDSDLTADLSLNSMAKLCNVSPNYFSALFKKETGLTLTEYVNERRIKLAKHLLKTTNLQVQTIAQHCGILDLHYFCRMFKKSVGLTPTQYKNKILFN